MASARILVLLVASISLWSSASSSYIWPNDQTDQLENILYEQVGFMSNNILPQIAGCTGFGTGGRNTGAEWIRNAYHDMAPADIATGIGGLDASIAFETNRPENVGKAFNATLGSFQGLLSTRSSMADLIALAAVAATGACSNGTVLVPLRAGRVDATGPGPSGVPEPQQDLETHTAIFAKGGFNTTEMIGLVACGHTIGGVHGVDFPEIVPDSIPVRLSLITTKRIKDGPLIFHHDQNDDNTASFDTTTNDFDNRVATEFVGNSSQNPLVSGQNITTRSDLRIFNSDGGQMLSNMATSSDFFLATCSSLLERMLNTVPGNVVLSDIIEPVLVKPRAIDIEINSNNGTMTVSGTVRIANTILPSPSSEVLITLSPRSGSPCSIEQPCPVATGTTAPIMGTTCIYPNCGGVFTFYNFEAVVPASQGVSSFTVEIADASTGDSVLYANGGQGFPISDALQPQLSLSARYFIENTQDGSSTIQLNLTAAVLNAEQFTDVSLIVPEAKPPGSLVPSWVPATIPMSPSQPIPGTNYTLYTGLYSTLPQAGANSHPYDIVATGPGVTVSNTYNSWGSLAEKVIIINS